MLAGAVFALLVLVIFNFAFDLRVENVAAVAPGVLWVTVTFAGVLSLGRAFARERDRRTLDGLLLAPIDRSALYLAKVITSIASMLVVEVVALPVFVGLFNLVVDLPLLVLAWCWVRSAWPASGRCSRPSPRTLAPAKCCCRCCCFPFRSRSSWRRRHREVNRLVSVPDHEMARRGPVE